MDYWIIGSGPAALVAADYLSKAGKSVHIAERRAAPGWKLLVAGASGLNVAYDCPDSELSSHYFARKNELNGCFEKFGREPWLKLLRSLGEETFLGSGRRYFLENKTAGRLLGTWKTKLEESGVTFHFGEELVDFASREGKVSLRFASGKEASAAAALLALGGPSWEDAPPLWPGIFTQRKIAFTPFTSANAGYAFAASPEFFTAHEGKPIKGLNLTTARGSRQGELMITTYGLEGTPVYTVGCPGPATMDLKPDVELGKLTERLRSTPGSIEAKVEKTAKLSPGALAIFRALAPRDAFASVEKVAHALKHLPLQLLEPRPLSECISARGGLSWDELDGLELKKMPGIFCAGEMVDWDAPTGGFLIQASASMGRVAAEAMAKKFP
ncbi:MAG: NAD(P)/FAD-dependent oxidoreductase [Bacteriovoracia bacterium]